MVARMGVRLVLATLTSFAFLYWTFKDVDGAALWHALCAMRPWGALAYVAALSSTQLTRALRWGMLVRPVCALEGRALWRVNNVGNMLIMLLPLRLGEFARPYLMREALGTPMSASLGAAVVERVLDGLTVTLLFFAVTYAQAGHLSLSGPLQAGAQVALALFLTLLFALGAATRYHRQVVALTRATLGRVLPTLSDRLLVMLEAFLVGLRATPDVVSLLGVLGWTLAYWAANAMGLHALIVASGWDLPLTASFTVVCVLVIGVMIPAGPGLLGTYQAAIMAGLSMYHVEKNAAAALSVVAYLGNLAVIVGFGLPYFVGPQRLRWPSLSAGVRGPG